MTRTIINLDPEDKDWLDRRARSEQVAMTEVVRRAVKAYRLREESHGREDLQDLLARTAGIWRQEDGLVVQDRIRDEWGTGD
ncbi:CopG family transcriptional regulator [Wenzhouxiangella sp. XN79A]|uniref:CopG family transcriptional regulator n=1 Tax=Wenzhouxiangella sp. XN79A TaxID=2724193 RepID=UPI00144AAB78|nr:CopG family transcriptional regulator [Wenzhouxiangella sp. XN79A]NKI33618.1 CopG family transcriptional regulator [Wenzhouxiangella sp. XN79A]